MSPKTLAGLIVISREHFKSLIGVVFSSGKDYEIIYDESVNRIIVQLNAKYIYEHFLCIRKNDIVNNIVDYFIYISDTSVKYHIEVKVKLW